MSRFNKTAAAAITGVIVTLIGALFLIDANLTGLIQTVLTAFLVWLVPNKGRRTP